MATHKPAAGQLNPFALPPETDARFILLMMSAPALAFALSQFLPYAFNPDAATPFTGVPPAPGNLPTEEYFRAMMIFALELMRASLAALVLPFSLIGLAFLLAVIFYRDHPRRIRRRKKSHRFSPQSDPRFTQELTALSSQAGLQTLPSIELGDKLTAQDGQAFGVGRQKSLYLDAGLRLQLRKSVENFRAVVRHELAHIVNHDIGRTYFAQSLWVSVAIVTVLPMLVFSSYQFLSSIFLQLVNGFTAATLQRLLFLQVPTFGMLLLQTGGLLALVLLVRAGLLRTREVYADWRAALWGSASTLASIFEAQSRRRKAAFNPLRLHPSPAERLDTLNRPRLLFDMHFDVPFVVGAFTFLILEGLIPIVILAIITVGPGLLALNAALIENARLQSGAAILWLRPVFYSVMALDYGATALLALLPFLIVAPLAAATLGLQVQRQSLADLAEARGGIMPYLTLAHPAAWMGLGMAVGIALSPAARPSPDVLRGALITMFFLITLVFFVWLALSYTRFFSRRLLGSHAKFTPPLGKSRFLTVLVTALFVALEAPLIAWHFFVSMAPAGGTLQGLLILAGITVAMLLLMGLIFVLQWLVFRLYRWLRPVRCPWCGAVSTDVPVVHKDCQRCGKSMVPWLYVTH